MEQNTAPIIIEGALEFEIDAVIAALEDREETEILGFPVVCGRLEGHPVIAARTKVGVVNAALLTTLLIDRYRPMCLISQGTAGSHLESLHTGEIVLGEKIVNINCCHMDERDCRAVEEMCRGEWSDHVAFASSPALLSAAGRAFCDSGRVVRGVIGSGDFWTHGADAIHAIQRRFGTFCEEMESFAVAQVCTRMGVPFLCARIISNNELCGEHFEEGLTQSCQRFILDTVRTLIRENDSGD